MAQNCAGCFQELVERTGHRWSNRTELQIRHKQEWAIDHVRKAWLTPMNPGTSQTFTKVPNPQNK